MKKKYKNILVLIRAHFGESTYKEIREAFIKAERYDRFIENGENDVIKVLNKLSFKI